jgi:protein-tyrosine phosphatase
MQLTSLKLNAAQARRLERFSATQCVDVHCHCLPGLDDGPQTYQEAKQLCAALAVDGITTVIATPHQLGPYDGSNRATEIRESCAELNRRLREDGIAINVVPGAEVRVDDQLLSNLDNDQVLTLTNGNKYILLELPNEIIFDLTSLICDLSDRGVTVVVAHPERYRELTRRPKLLSSWIDSGAILQLTAASLVGGFGPVAQRMGWDLIESNLASLVATDAHDCLKRPPVMSRAIDAIAHRLGHPVARRLCVENPQAILDGRPIPPPHQRSLSETGSGVPR